MPPAATAATDLVRGTAPPGRRRVRAVAEAPGPAVQVELASQVTDELAGALQRLVPQLSSAPPPTRQELAEVVSCPCSRLLVARLGGRLVGALTLVVFRIPTGLRAWIEDVVVDESVRGRGVGAALTRAALDHAVQAGARTVDLTSRPSRQAANRLYQKLGFEQRQTNVYRWRCA